MTPTPNWGELKINFMKWLFLFFISITALSCNKEYHYTMIRVDLDGRLPMDSESKTIYAKNDLDAYEKGVIAYSSAVFAHKVINIKTKSGSLIAPPYCYTLYNDKGQRVTEIVDQVKSYEILKSVLAITQNNAREYGVEIESHEIIGRDVIK